MSSIKALGRHKIFQVAVIGKYLNGVWGGLKFGTPFFKASYNSHELLVVYLIVALSRTMFL